MFNLSKIEGGRINVHEPERHTVGASALAIGTVCVLTNGVLVAATGTTKPTHITLASGAEGASILCGVIAPNQVYETTVSAKPDSLKVGAKVTVGSAGADVTATTEGGIATVVDLLGAAAAGDVILVRFN